MSCLPVDVTGVEACRVRRNLAGIADARRAEIGPESRLAAARDEMRQRHAHDLADRVAALPYALAIPPRRGTEGGREDAPRCTNRSANTIWQYWGQGVDAAPPIVRRCLESVAANAGARKVIVLTDATLSRHVDMPPEFSRTNPGITRTHFSDLLRVELLYRHGGIWIDATVLMTGPIPDAIEHADFFCYTRPADPYLLSSWFIKAAAADPMLFAWRAMLRHYWRENDRLLNYFLLHYLFEAAITVHADLREHWLRTPALSSHTCHLLQGRLPLAFDPEWFASIRRQTTIHKL